RHLHYGRIENVEQELRRDANGEHEQCYRHDDEPFAWPEVRECRAVRVERSAKQRLHYSHERDRSEKQAEHGNSGVWRGCAKRTFENQEFTDKAVQSRQTE